MDEIDKSKVFGMAGILDTARYRAFLATALNVSPKDIQAVLMGGHGDTMVPMPRHCSIGGVPLTEMLTPERVEALVDRTRKGGAEIVELLKNGSAFYAPATAAMDMAEAYLKDRKRMFACAAYLTGQYGVNGMYVGVPVIIGSGGVEKIVEIDLNSEEQTMFDESVSAVKGLVEVIDKFAA